MKSNVNNCFSVNVREFVAIECGKMSGLVNSISLYFKSCQATSRIGSEMIHVRQESNRQNFSHYTNRIIFSAFLLRSTFSFKNHFGKDSSIRSQKSNHVHFESQ